MATDATGTPTPKGIPKYNPDNDAPSGLGFNAAMDAIDGLLTFLKVRKNSGGSDFERQRLNLIEGSGITITMADDAGNNEVDVTIAAGTVNYGTTLPGSPTDGQEAVLVDSVTNPTYQWRFRYNAGSLNTDKWEFVGGSPAYAKVAASESTASTAYVALTTVGPSFTIPRGGVYRVEVGSKHGPYNSNESLHSYDIGATGAVDGDAAVHNESSGSNSSSMPVSVEEKSLTASTALVSKYRALNATSVSFSERWIRVTPVRVS